MNLRSIVIGGETYLHSKSVAVTLGVAQTTIRGACSKKLLTGKQVGGSWYIQKKSLTGFLKQMQRAKINKSASTQVKRKTEIAEIRAKVKNSIRLFRVGNEIRRGGK